jgi:putative FmdB family regulatory protein
MPLYEYRCDNCGDLFEVMQKFADEPLKKHEKCGGEVHRLLSAPALQFKGSGWYVNDYAKSSAKQPNGPSKKDDGGTKTGTESGGSGSSSSSAGETKSSKPGSSSDTK